MALAYFKIGQRKICSLETAQTCILALQDLEFCIEKCFASIFLKSAPKHCLGLLLDDSSVHLRSVKPISVLLLT